MSINWTTVFASAVSASIISAASFIGNRYLARILDRIEREVTRKPGKGEKDGDGNGGDGSRNGNKPKTS